MKVLDKIVKFAKLADEYTDQKLCALERYICNGRTIDEHGSIIQKDVKEKVLPWVKGLVTKEGDK